MNILTVYSLNTGKTNKESTKTNQKESSNNQNSLCQEQGLAKWAMVKKIIL